MKTNQERPKATKEQLREYHELNNKLDSLASSGSEKEANAIAEKLNKLEHEYDWFNTEFTDPATGKKGMKNVADELVAPALYDDFKEYNSYLFASHNPVIAVKDGKCGIIAGDGSGNVLCAFEYDEIQSMPFSPLYLYGKGDKEHFGIITVRGDVICPNILTAYNDVVNGIVATKGDEKYGAVDIETYQCVLPEYDAVEVETEGNVLFYKNGQKGYVTVEGEFITLEQYENDDKYSDADFLCTRLP